VLKTIPRSSCLNLGLIWPGGEVSWGCRPVGPTLVTTCSQKISCAIGSTSHRSDTKDSSRRWNSAGGQSIAAKKKRAAEAALFASIAYAAPLLIRRHVLKRRPDVRIAQLNSPGRRDSIPVVPVVVGLRVRGLDASPGPMPALLRRCNAGGTEQYCRDHRGSNLASHVNLRFAS
jgi:hypothetical protein